MGLKEYRKKRKFSKTPEPKGKAKKSKTSIFAVQKHDARNLHYDFRLEINGVLKSWAIPKGPSMDPKQRRLAIGTEDHPMDYASFEGVIPEGLYGAGIVMVWDKGTYRNVSEKYDSMKESYKKGHISVELKGKKLKGGFALIKTPRGWLLVKRADKYASKSDVLKKTKSAKTGRTLKQIKKR